MTDWEETINHLRAAIRALRGDKELGDVCRGMIADDIEAVLDGMEKLQITCQQLCEALDSALSLFTAALAAVKPTKES